MTDLTVYEPELQVGIRAALPSISNEIQQELLKLLHDLGVDCCEDMDYVTEENLLTLLKPVWAKKIMKYFKSDGPPIPHEEHRTSLATNSSILKDVTNTSPVNTSSHSLVNGSALSRELDNYTLDNAGIPVQIQEHLKNGSPLVVSEKNELVRLIAMDILLKCRRPRKADLERVAMAVVGTYPKSLQDSLCGRVLGRGYCSFLNKLQVRVDNVLRKTDIRIRTPKRSQNETATVTSSNKKKKNSYGEKDFPKYLPPLTPSEKVNLLSIKETLQSNFPTVPWNEATEKDMEACFPVQRSDIVSGLTLIELRKNWPYLFELKGLMLHLNILVGDCIQTTLTKSLLEKLPVLIKFFKSMKKSEASDPFKEVSEEQARDNDITVRVILRLVADFFKEDVKNLLCLFPENTTTSDVEASDYPSPHPCILVFGDSFLESRKFCLAVDGQLLFSGAKSFSTALATLMGCYYVFDIAYPASAALTMEFVQRCFLQINSGQVSRRLLTLLTKMALNEWTSCLPTT